MKAHLGINVDKMCVETLTGARNRINEMMKFGLPVVTTAGTEIAEDVEKVGAGLAVQSGDCLALAEAIEDVYRSWNEGNPNEKYKSFVGNGERYTKENSYEKTLKPLLEWLKDPKFAPDRNIRVHLEKGLSLRTLWYYLKENGFKKSFKKFLQKIGT